MRLSFPTQFTKEQNTYFIENKTRMYLFDNAIQFIYKMSFNLGEIQHDGLDDYVFNAYSLEEKKFFITNPEILFARRDYVDINGDTVNQVLPNNGGYTFLNDQVVYDPQVGDDVFRNKAVVNVQNVTTTGKSFVPYTQQLAVSRKIMKNKAWIRRFAQKHFVIIFKSNELNENPRIFYGVPLKYVRIHPYDKLKY